MRKSNPLRMDVWGVVTIVLMLFYLSFMVYPLGNLFRMAFFNSSGQFTFANFSKFFSKPYYFNTLKNSFSVSFWTTVCSVVIGVPIAYFLTMYQVKGKKLLRMLIIISSMSAPFVGAYAWILLLGRSGVITKFFAGLGINSPNIYGFKGMLLVFTSQLFSLVYLYVTGALNKMDNSLLEASENFGCKGVKRFFKVVVPLIMPTILAGALLVFIRALSDFGTPMLMGEGFRTFPVVMYTEFVGEVSQNKGFASAIAVMAIIITTAVFSLQTVASKRFSFSMSALHPIEAKPLQGARKILIHAYCYLVVAIAMLPQVYVFYTSFLKTNGIMYVDGYTLDSYKNMFGRLGRSVQNSLIIPGVALLMVVVIAVLMAYLSVRRRNTLTSTLDALSMVPYIIPGTVIGIALVISFNRRPIALTGTMIIMIIALVIRRMPYTIRSSVAILQQIPITVEEAALSLGSSRMKTFWRITLPMMSSGVISGAILSWVNMITELSTAMFLYTNRTQTLTVAIYTQVIRGNYGIAAAMASLLTVLTVLSLLVFNRISKNSELSM